MWARIAAERFDALEAVYVLAADGRFEGAIPLVDLGRARPEQTLGELVDREYPRVGRQRGQEHIASEAHPRASSLAVIGDGGRFLGAIPALTLLSILRREHVEDLHRLAGIQREMEKDRGALEAPSARRARHRLPWLLVGLVGSVLAAAVVARFEKVLEANLAVAYFVPTIVYLADAIGTQTEAIAVRGLSMSRLSLSHLLGGELRTGILIGATLAVLTFPIVVLMFGDLRLGLAVAIAVVTAGTVATTIGLLFPWFLHRLGSDPALGSGPVATIVQDVLSLLIYFATARLVMS